MKVFVPLVLPQVIIIFTRKTGLSILINPWRRAVLQQPETRFDLENGNASTETIYQNPSVQEVWPKGQPEADGTGSYVTDRGNWSYEKEVSVSDEKEKSDSSTNTKKRPKRRVSETALCEKDNDMKPAALNSLGDK
ncbi:hypothetical protein O3G_MSEX010663 [Manduca sexta]|uniref:Uncharacterized protein n=1 Tax=Manduca sexta TaxID=7130 RepID=A0A921ZHC2_MANSE|nr:hypothetical protein O3G_MSEX010663 [Manduca sexta]